MRGRAGRVQGEAQLALFLGWKELAARSRKCRALLNRIRNAPAMLAWERWVEYMCTDGMWWEPGPELQAALQAKCGRVLALLGSDALRSSFAGWLEIASKNARAMRRWKMQGEHHALSEWKDYLMQTRDWKRIQGAIRRRRAMNLRWETLLDWQLCAQERRYNRSVITDAAHMWVNRPAVWAFRSMDEFAQKEKHMRLVIRRFRARFDLRPAQKMILLLREYVDRMVEMRLLMRRITHAGLLACLVQWRDYIQALRIAHGEELAAKSPLLLRFLKRPMVRGFEGWRDAFREQKRHRQILERMAFRMQYACVVQVRRPAPLPALGSLHHVAAGFAVDFRVLVDHGRALSLSPLRAPAPPPARRVVMAARA